MTVMKKTRVLLAVLLLSVSMTAGCGTDGGTKDTAVTTEETEASSESEDSKVASADEMVEPEDVVEEGMEPVYGDSVKNGTYAVTVESSSSMFRITACELTVENGEMTAVMTMSGTGYTKLYMGTGEEAVAASEDDYILNQENENGEYTFTVPVEALDKGIDCTAYSKKKEKWYDRVILFRKDSLPAEAFTDGSVTSAESLQLENGATYQAEVTLSGGSGRAGVESPATLTVADGVVTATIVWSSSNYDYMLVDDVKYLPVNTEGNSTFEIPVAAFDYDIAVIADTIAMSQPYEISYTLHFDSSTLEKTE